MDIIVDSYPKNAMLFTYQCNFRDFHCSLTVGEFWNEMAILI